MRAAAEVNERAARTLIRRLCSLVKVISGSEGGVVRWRCSVRCCLPVIVCHYQYSGFIA